MAIAAARGGRRVFTLDEPTPILMKRVQAGFSETLAELKKQGHTLIVAEHRLSWLMGIADRFLYVDGGRIVPEFSRGSWPRFPPAKPRGWACAVR